MVLVFPSHYSPCVGLSAAGSFLLALPPGLGGAGPCRTPCLGFLSGIHRPILSLHGIFIVPHDALLDSTAVALVDSQLHIRFPVQRIPPNLIGQAGIGPYLCIPPLPKGTICGGLLGVLAVVFSAIEMSQNRTKKGFATAGLALGIFACGLAFVVFLVVLADTRR